MRSSARSKFPWLVAAVIALVMAAASSVSAETSDASELWSSAGFMKGCRAFEDMAAGVLKAPVSFDESFGAGYCYGVVDATVATLPSDAACPPKGKDTGNHIAAINKVVQEYRESLALDRSSPASIAIQGLVIAYPCKG